MANNPFVLPKITTPNREINQIQQNIESGVNKALTGIINSVTVIGEQRSAYLTEAQFQAQAGNNWWLCDGRSSIGTDYQSLTGLQTIPNAGVTTPKVFIKVNS